MSARSGCRAGGGSISYLLAAKLVVLAHVAFVGFVLLGGLLLSAHRWLAWIHAPCLGYAILVTIIGWSCPLTRLEQWLLGRGGAQPYSGEFLPHYVWSHFGLTGAELPVAAGLILALVAPNVVPYGAVLRARQR